MSETNASTDQILLVGAGPMARAYVEVLKALGAAFHVVRRDHEGAREFTAETGIRAVGGGLAEWLQNNPAPDEAIVATGVEALEETATLLMESGCRTVLLEKPGALNGSGIQRLARLAEAAKASVWIGFNRRYYASVAAARDIVNEDGGLSSAFFDFTELGYRIEALEKAPGVKERWFFANSLHVVDLAFHLAGEPEEMESRIAGGLPWHETAAQFAGSGLSKRGVCFSYRADWAAPGRWKVELFTPKRRLVLRPLETLQVQNLGSFDECTLELDDALDNAYKPGLYRQVEAWLARDSRIACTIGELARMANRYEQMAGYEG
jgi:predicted dehydrogenase